MNSDETSEVGGNVMRGRIGVNERVIRKMVREEKMGELKKMKGDKATGVDNGVAEC